MAAFKEYADYDALGLGELIAKKQVTAQEVLEAAIERIEAANPRLNAVVQKIYDEARPTIRAGLPQGPLAGVPFLLKDLYAWQKGARIGNGSRLYDGFIADHDFTLVERYKAAGLVILGRTNTPEFGLNAATEPVVNGPTRNPWNLEHSSGGSSGGAAAAVAAGMVPAAHATDGGGSIRIPAANCGLFGLKPNRGRNPAGPDVGEGWSGLACGHALSRSVRDSAALLDAISGPAPGDPYWAPPPARPFLQEVRRQAGQAAHRAQEQAHHRHAGPSRLRRGCGGSRQALRGARPPRRRGDAEIRFRGLGLGHARHHLRQPAQRSRFPPGVAEADRSRAISSASPRYGTSMGGATPPATMPARSSSCMASAGASASSSPNTTCCCRRWWPSRPCRWGPPT